MSKSRIIDFVEGDRLMFPGYIDDKRRILKDPSYFPKLEGVENIHLPLLPNAPFVKRVRKDLEKMKPTLQNIEYDGDEILGKGCYGQVRKAYVKGAGPGPGIHVAIKEYDADEGKDWTRVKIEEMEKLLWNDGLILHIDENGEKHYLEPHENVCDIYYATMDKHGVIGTTDKTGHPGMLLMQAYDHTAEECRKHRARKIELGDMTRMRDKEIAYFIRDVSRGALHLHKNFIVHRDIRPENILMEKLTGKFIVGDFGCSLNLYERQKEENPFLLKKEDKELYQNLYSFGHGKNKENFKKAACLRYCPPEIKNFDFEKDDQPLDFSNYETFSIALMAYQFMNLDMTKKEFIYNITNEEIREYFDDSSGVKNNYDCQLNQLLLRMTEQNPENRISHEDTCEWIDRIINRLENNTKKLLGLIFLFFFFLVFSLFLYITFLPLTKRLGHAFNNYVDSGGTESKFFIEFGSNETFVTNSAPDTLVLFDDTKEKEMEIEFSQEAKLVYKSIGVAEFALSKGLKPRYLHLQPDLNIHFLRYGSEYLYVRTTNLLINKCVPIDIRMMEISYCIEKLMNVKFNSIRRMITNDFGFGEMIGGGVDFLELGVRQGDRHHGTENFEWRKRSVISVVLEVVKQSEELQNDKEFVLEVVKLNGYSLKYASEELKNDKKVVLEAVKHEWNFGFEFVELKDRKISFFKSCQKGHALKYASEELQNDKEFVIEVEKLNGYALKYASEELRKDKEVVLEAVKQNGYALKFASEELKNDKEVVLEAVKLNGYSLMYASEELKNDKNVVLEAVKHIKWTLWFASEELKNDKEFVIEVVKKEGYALEYANEEHQNDKEVVLEAVKQNGYALEYASEELKNDKEFVLEVVKLNGYSLKYASEELKNDKEFVLEVVKLNGYSLKYASEELKNDKNVVLEAVKQYGYALAFASEELKNDKKVVLEATKQYGFALAFASEELQNDKEFVLEAVKWDSLLGSHTIGWQNLNLTNSIT